MAILTDQNFFPFFLFVHNFWLNVNNNTAIAEFWEAVDSSSDLISSGIYDSGGRLGFHPVVIELP